MWAFLNPMNWGKAYLVFKAFFEGCSSLWNAYVEYQKQASLSKKMDELKRIQEEQDVANQIADDEERLRAKAKAAHDLENLIAGPQ